MGTSRVSSWKSTNNLQLSPADVLVWWSLFLLALPIRWAASRSVSSRLIKSWSSEVSIACVFGFTTVVYLDSLRQYWGRMKTVYARWHVPVQQPATKCHSFSRSCCLAKTRNKRWQNCGHPPKFSKKRYHYVSYRTLCMCENQPLVEQQALQPVPAEFYEIFQTHT